MEMGFIPDQEAAAVRRRTPQHTPRIGSGHLCRGSGFTLIELLVVIAIIALLIGILLPMLAGARSTARQVRELASGNQIMVATTLYVNDNDDAILPGFASRTMVVDDLIVRNEVGERITGPAAQRHPWRLAPYLDYNFDGLYHNDRALRELRLRPDYEYVVSLFPLFGMNAQFVGGHADYLAFNQRAQRRFGRFYIERLSQVRRPTQVIAFASARPDQSSLFGLAQFENADGYHVVLAPRLTEAGRPQWQASYDPQTTEPGQNSGFLALRHRNKAAIVTLDGHAEALDWEELQDMRRWSDHADAPDWGLQTR